jgi:hypothetical protein
MESEGVLCLHNWASRNSKLFRPRALLHLKFVRKREAELRILSSDAR